MAVTTQPVLVYRAKNSLEASAVAAYLEGAGVEAHVVGEFLQGAYAGLNVGGMDAPEIWVASDDLLYAQELIAEWRAGLSNESPDDVAPQAGHAKPFKLQFSMAALLWLMTCVAIFAAGVSFDLVTYENWPSWVFGMFVYSLVLIVFVKGLRRIFAKPRPGRNDDDEGY